MKRDRYAEVEELRGEFTRRGRAIRQRLTDFAAVRSDDYFYELIYCLMTPQSSAVNAGKAVEKLRARDFLVRDFDPAPVLHAKDAYIRFHNTKAQRLRETRKNYPTIAQALSSGGNSEEIRLWLVNNVKGLGWKEASHFLRNIGHRNLAILDRHILRNLQRHCVIARVPATLTPARYRAIEAKFRAFAEHTGITLDELDLLFWSRETGEILK
jgi:N-glycosylase/DNA lyase